MKLSSESFENKNKLTKQLPLKSKASARKAQVKQLQRAGCQGRAHRSGLFLWECCEESPGQEGTVAHPPEPLRPGWVALRCQECPSHPSLRVSQPPWAGAAAAGGCLGLAVPAGLPALHSWGSQEQPQRAPGSCPALGPLSLLLLSQTLQGCHSIVPLGQAGLGQGAEHVWGCSESWGGEPAHSLLVLEQISVHRSAPFPKQAFRALCIHVSSSMRHAPIEAQCTSTCR